MDYVIGALLVYIVVLIGLVIYQTHDRHCFNMALKLIKETNEKIEEIKMGQSIYINCPFNNGKVCQITEDNECVNYGKYDPETETVEILDCCDIQQGFDEWFIERFAKEIKKEIPKIREELR